MTMRRDTFLVFLSPLVLVALGLGVVRIARDRDARNLERAGGEDLYREVTGLLQDGYVIEPDEDRLAFAAARGMTQSLDPHCRVYDGSEWAENQTENEGRYAGIGIVADNLRGRWTILEVNPRGPAAAAGLEAGDRIVAVGGRPVEDLSLHDSLQGIPGSEVRLTVVGPAPALEREVTARRAMVEQRTAWGAVLDEVRGVGYLAITAIRANTADLVKRELARLRRLGQKSLVLDLRENRGGLVDPALEIADRFLDEGPLVSTIGRHHRSVREAEPGAPDGDWPMVVLVDGRTASAAEIIAGALQDHHRAVLVGERTFGKGVVQVIMAFQSRAGGIKFTTAHYFTPAGRCLERSVGLGAGGARRGGLRPDLTVAIEETRRQTCDRHRDRLRYDPSVQRLLDEEPSRRLPDGFADPQIAAALALLRGEAAPDREAVVR